jgi:hypothetical protein
LCFVTFCAQKVTKKAWLSKNLTILTPLRRRKKNSPLDLCGPAAPMIPEAQTVFCLTRLGRRQNGDFSKAICHAAWYSFLLKWVDFGKMW